MSYLDFVNGNIYIYLGIIIGLLIINIVLTIVCVRQRKRKKIKEDFMKLEQEIDEINEIEEDSNMDVKKNSAFELEEILSKMQKDIETEPEDVVKMFEEEQEQKAIISYQELLNSVNNNKIDVIEDDEGDINFVEALTEPKSISSNLDVTPTSTPLYDNYQGKSHLDVIDELNSDDDKKFKHSEILSPVFGRMQPEYEYRKLDSFANNNNKIEIEQVRGNSISDEIKDNEDFLKALIEFRNNL